VRIERVSSNFVKVTANFGYTELPRIDEILHACGAKDLDIDKDDVAFVYAHPVIIGKPGGGMPRWQRYLFEVMQRVSRRLAEDLEIKPDRRVEIGVEVAV
jgi:KUP system potassium uptake protein